MPSAPPASPTRSRLALLTGVAHDERVALAWSFLYFFSLLCAYGLLRPLREEMGVRHGVSNLQWLFSGTFVCMLLAQPLYGALVSRFERRVFLPVVYGFFIACLVAFYAVFRLNRGMAVAVPAFFIWVSVFNLFVVSVFWSFMSDIFTTDQAKRAELYRQAQRLLIDDAPWIFIDHEIQTAAHTKHAATIRNVRR